MKRYSATKVMTWSKEEIQALVRTEGDYDLSEERLTDGLCQLLVNYFVHNLECGERLELNDSADDQIPQIIENYEQYQREISDV